MKKNTLFAIWLISFLSGMIGCNLYLNWAEEETPALEIEPIDIESLLTEIEAKDSAILLMYEKIDSLSKQKQIVTTRTVTLYKKIGVDSSLTSEVIYNHSELDDTLVSYPFNEMVQFRLIQGLEARGLLNICEVEKNVLAAIIEQKNDIIGIDSTIILNIQNKNYQLTDTINRVNSDNYALIVENASLRKKKYLYFGLGFASGIMALLGIK